MTIRRLALLLALAALLAPALRAEPEPEPAAPPPPDVEEIDILSVTPDALGGPDTRTLQARANAAYGEKRYEDAARLYIRALRRSPGDSGALYNLACCYGLLGHAEQAAAFLEAAYRSGFHDLGWARNDPDFAGVREHEAFAAVMEKLGAADEKRRAGLGTLLEVTAPVVGTVRVVEPEKKPGWGERMPLVLALHGYGDNADNFAGLFVRRDLPQPFLFVTAQAPYASHGGSRIGYSWSFAAEGADTRLNLASLALAERYVLRVLETVKTRYRIDERKVFLLGFSQGAGMAFSIGMRHPELFAGVIPVGGWLDAGAHAPAVVERAAEAGLFLVCHSPEDRMVEWESCERAKAFLEEHDIPHAVLSYPGGHSLTPALLRAVTVWIADPDAEAPLLPAPTPTAPPTEPPKEGD